MIFKIVILFYEQKTLKRIMKFYNLSHFTIFRFFYLFYRLYDWNFELILRIFLYQKNVSTIPLPLFESFNSTFSDSSYTAYKIRGKIKYALFFLECKSVYKVLNEFDRFDACIGNTIHSLIPPPSLLFYYYHECTIIAPLALFLLLSRPFI